MPGCSAKRCGRNSSKKDQLDDNGHKITFHQFPTNIERKEVWIENVRDGGKGMNWNPNHNAKLCSLHFEEHYIERITTDKNRPLTKLKEDAVPTIFPYKAKLAKAAVRHSTAAVQDARRSERIASSTTKIVDYAQLVKQCVEEEDFIERTQEEAIIAPLFVQGDRKMVTLPADEGIRVILPNIGGAELLQDTTQESLPGPMLAPQSPMTLTEDWDSTNAPAAPSAKFVSLKGAQPFNDDQEAESSEDDLCKAGPSSSTDDEACCSNYYDMSCVAVENNEKMEGTSAHKLQQVLEMLQSLQIDLMKNLPSERLCNLSHLTEQLSIEGNMLLREQAILSEQVSAYKRFNDNMSDAEAGKRAKSSEFEEFQCNLPEEQSCAMFAEVADYVEIETLPAMPALSMEDLETFLAALNQEQQS